MLTHLPSTGTKISTAITLHCIFPIVLDFIFLFIATCKRNPRTDNLPYEKVGENEPVCIADQVPFEIPESWEWSRIGSLFTLQAGKNIQASEIKDTSFSGAIRCFGGNGVRGYVSKSNRNGDYPIIGRQGALCGNICRAFGEFYATEHAVCVETYGKTDVDWACFFLEALNLNQYATATAQPGLAVSKINEVLIPVPPIKEQNRIAAKLVEVFPLVDVYNKKEIALISLQKIFSDQLKKSILQMAVQGKLVPQDPNDEPASVLLERIREEKHKLIEKGKIKKDKHDSIIFRRDNSHYEKRGSKDICIDNEIPFEVPKSWAWSRVSSLGVMVRGRGIKRTETVKKGFPCIRYGEIYTSYNYSFTNAISYISQKLDESCLHFSTGDVVFTLTGENKVDIAKAVAFIGEGQIAAGGDLAYWTAHGMNPLYLVYYMACPYCIEQKRRTATGDIIVHISNAKIGDFLIPVPPINEQQRIVSAIEALYSAIATL